MSKAADLEKEKSEADDEENESSGERAASANEDDEAAKATLKDDAEDEAEPKAEAKEEPKDEPRDAAAPAQLGHKRFVYAGYMGGAIGIAFLISKIGNVAWYRLSQWKPQWGLGDPKDELIMAAGALIGGAVALYYWRKKKARQYIEEVAEELSKVTWPSRKEVTQSTMVVVFTTLVMTVFFALMDQFWRYVTDKIYSF
jgi:preprotein translocase subunit SecE